VLTGTSIAGSSYASSVTQDAVLPAVQRPVKVLVLVNWLSRGGATNLALQIIVGLRRRGAAVVPVVVQLRPGEVLPDGSWHSLDFNGDYRNPLAVRAAVRRLRSIAKDEAVDVIETFLWTSDVIGALACASLRVPHVSYILDRRRWLSSREWQQRLRRVWTAQLFRRARTRFVAISDSAARYFEAHLPLRTGAVRLARNAVDPSAFQRTTPAATIRGRLRAGVICRLVEEKGVEYLVRAVRLARERGAVVDLEVAGEGPERQRLLSLTAELQLDGCVRFPGDVPSARAFYEGIDVFVVPSIHSEGLPTTILEAMAMELPVIATDVGGAIEAVVDGVTGLIVAPRSESALADALVRMASNPGRSLAMGTTGRKRIEESFTLDGLLDAHLASFRDLLAGSW
jgi:glycosyltransferase involved in cell wall biosynthesis